jgi:hypothetical protein
MPTKFFFILDEMRIFEHFNPAEDTTTHDSHSELAMWVRDEITYFQSHNRIIYINRE